MTVPTRREEHRRMWSRPVLIRYWAMQLPGTVIVVVVALSFAEGLGWQLWAVPAIVAAWIAKDAALYLFVWPAYDPGWPTALPYRMEGASGVAVDRLAPHGTVRIWGELWRAEVSPPEHRVDPGQKVKVKSRHGLTLVVEPQPLSKE